MISHGSVAICDAGPLIHLDELGCPQLLDEYTSYFRFFCISQRHHEVVILAKPAKMGSHGQETDLLSNHHSSTAVPAL
jgi:hypothetical protein